MNIHLRSLQLVDEGGVVAEFSIDGEEALLSALFVVIDGDVTMATPTPNVFRGFQGTAEELRSIVAAVVAFSRACS
jgi:hypothetical protein